MLARPLERVRTRSSDSHCLDPHLVNAASLANGASLVNAASHKVRSAFPFLGQSPIVQQRSSRRAARQYPTITSPKTRRYELLDLAASFRPRSSTRNRGGHCVLVPFSLHLLTIPARNPANDSDVISGNFCCSKLRFVDRCNLRYMCPHYPRAPGGGWEVDVGQEVRVLRPGAIATARRKISECNARYRRHGFAGPEVFFAVAVGTCDYYQLHALGLYCMGCLAPLVANRHRAP